MSAPLPHGFVPEVEQQLLGALLEGGNHTALLSSLEERQFVNALHAGIYGAIRTAHDRYSSTALPVVAKVADDELHRLCKQLTGGDLNPYLAALSADTVYSAGTAAKAAQNVVKQHARVLLAQEAGRIAAAAADPAADPQELVRATGTTFDDIVTDLRQGARRRSRVHAAEASAAAMQAAREAQERQGLTGITSGLVDIDRQTGGLQCRDLTLIAARPSMGKTTLGTSIAVRAARAGHGVGFVSLEMDAEKLATRCISDIAHEAGIWVPYSDVIKGSATRQQLDSLADASAEFGRLPAWSENQPHPAFAAIGPRVKAIFLPEKPPAVRLDL